MMRCMSDECDGAFYIEGVVMGSSRETEHGRPFAVMPYSCPLCGFHMKADQYVARVGGGAIAWTDPDVLILELQVLLDSLEAGEATPSDVAEQLRATEGMSPLVRFIESRGATASIIASVLVGVLMYINPPGEEPPPGLTPEQIEQIVESVVSEIDEQPTGESAPKSGSQPPGQMPPIAPPAEPD